MRKTQRKTKTCLNCGTLLQDKFEFCPTCGQENHDQALSFGQLIKDFFDNYFSLDSRFGRSIKPFFLKPGFLTSEFMAGKRMSYANPVRLYLVISLIHFFILSISVSDQEENEKSTGIINISESEQKENDPPVKVNLSENEDQLDSLKSKGDSWPMSAKEFLHVKEMSKDGRYAYREILDSLHNDEKPFFQRHVIKQLVKLEKSDQSSIRDMILKNIPMLMFFLLPVYALILKVFFRKRLYIHHIIHSLHIHSFAFFALMFLWMINIFSESMAESAFIYIAILLMIYLTVSFKRTYSIKRFTAFYKVLLSGFIYSIALAIGLLMEVIASFLLF